MAYEAFGEDGPRPRNDVYTGLLAISFFATVIACLLLLVDWYGYEGSENPAKKILKSLPPVKPVAAAAPAGDLGKPAPKKEAAPPPPPPAKDKVEVKDKMDAKDGKD